MFIRIINIIIIIIFFSTFGLADVDTDQWQDSDKTYNDLISDGFEVKAYDINTIEINNGLKLIMFVTVLQKNKEVYECQEYQTIDDKMNTLDLSFICRQLVQPYQQGIGT